MKRRGTLLTIGITIMVLATVGLTYALWLLTKTQTNYNQVTAKCLDISITGEENDINLADEYPMSDVR